MWRRNPLVILSSVEFWEPCNTDIQLYHRVSISFSLFFFKPCPCLMWPGFDGEPEPAAQWRRKDVMPLTYPVPYPHKINFVVIPSRKTNLADVLIWNKKRNVVQEIALWLYSMYVASRLTVTFYILWVRSEAILAYGKRDGGLYYSVVTSAVDLDPGRLKWLLEKEIIGEISFLKHF